MSLQLLKPFKLLKLFKRSLLPLSAPLRQPDEEDEEGAEEEEVVEEVGAGGGIAAAAAVDDAVHAEAGAGAGRLRLGLRIRCVMIAFHGTIFAGSKSKVKTSGHDMKKILRHHAPLLGALLLASCEKAEVKTYTESAEAVAPHQAAAANAPMMGMPGKAAPLPQGTDSILGAIFREPEAMWFFKVVGSSEETGTITKGVVDFIGSMDFKDQEAVWTLPQGWSELPGAGFRYRSFKIEDKKLDISLTRMPPGNDLNANLNRWASQLGIDPHSPERIQRPSQFERQHPGVQFPALSLPICLRS